MSLCRRAAPSHVRIGRRRCLRAVACVALVSLSAGGIGAQAYASITGIVLDTTTAGTAGKVISVAQAEVTLVGTRHLAVTDTSGTFRLGSIPVGAYLLRIRRVGYTPLQTTVTVRAGASTDLLFALSPVRQELETVTVKTEARRSARLEQFEIRRRRGLGTFITRSTLEGPGIVSLSGALRRLAGVRIIDSIVDGSHVPVAVSSHGAKFYNNHMVNCVLRIVVDDVVMPEGFALDQVSPNDIEAIEVYDGPSTVPSQYASMSSSVSCGVILLWTKDGG